jgi:hypothetical protein
MSGPALTKAKGGRSHLCRIMCAVQDSMLTTPTMSASNMPGSKMPAGAMSASKMSRMMSRMTPKVMSGMMPTIMMPNVMPGVMPVVAVMKVGRPYYPNRSGFDHRRLHDRRFYYGCL